MRGLLILNSDCICEKIRPTELNEFIGQPVIIKLVHEFLRIRCRTWIATLAGCVRFSLITLFLFDHFCRIKSLLVVDRTCSVHFILPHSRRHFRIQSRRQSVSNLLYASYGFCRCVHECTRRMMHTFVCICAEAGLISCHCTILISLFHSYFVFSENDQLRHLFSHFSQHLLQYVDCFELQHQKKNMLAMKRKKKMLMMKKMKRMHLLFVDRVQRYLSFVFFSFQRCERNRLRLRRRFFRCVFFLTLK